MNDINRIKKFIDSEKFYIMESTGLVNAMKATHKMPDDYWECFYRLIGKHVPVHNNWTASGKVFGNNERTIIYRVNIEPW